MDNNSYSNILDGSKSAGQPVYRCGLCLKEFLYYRDLAVHERVHLVEQMTLADRLQESVRPAYDNRSSLYNPAPSVPITTLDSFDKLVQPFRGESAIPRVGHTDIRSTVPASSTPDADKIPQVYRTEPDNRSVPLSSRASPADSRSLNMDMRSLPVDNRALTLDSRAISSLDTRNIQPVDSRALAAAAADTRSLAPVDTRSLPVDTRSLPVDTRALPFTSTSYLDSINPSMYSSEHHKIPTSSPAPAFQVQQGLRPDDYIPVDNRNQTLPKLDAQIFSKPDPYYGISKAHYSSLGSVEKPHPNYASPQYGLPKLLGQAPPSPYYPQPLVGQEQPKYDMDKLPSPSSLNYYNQPGISQAEPKLEKRQPSPSPKQTLYYGQPPAPTHPVTMATNSQYQINLSKPSHLHFQTTRDLLNKPFPEKPEVGKTYQSGHVSPHLTYTDVYKGSQPQSQVFSPVPSQPAHTQHDYSFYKHPSAPVQSSSLESKPPRVGSLAMQECECYICLAPFPNMHELSEHMKIHARENIAMETSPQVRHQYPPSAALSTNSAGVSNSYPSASVSAGPPAPVNSSAHISGSLHLPPPPTSASATGFRPPVKDSLACQICGKTFLKATFLAEHVKIHLTKPQQHFECKQCKKVFNKQSKLNRHEALHQRNIKLFYCEICEKDFTYKGNYLYHVQVEHTRSQTEERVGNKTAVVNFGAEKVVDCQICDEEIAIGKLVDHLKTHSVHTCNKCDRVFIVKAEYVEHLMAVHWRELAEASDAKSGGANSDNEKKEENKSERRREESEEKDSGLEEDHEKDKEDTEAEESLPEAPAQKIHAESIKPKIKTDAETNIRSKPEDVTVKPAEMKKETKELQPIGNMKKKKEQIDVKMKKETTKVKKETAKAKVLEKETKSFPKDKILEKETKSFPNDKVLEKETKSFPKDKVLEKETKGFPKDVKFKFSCSKCDESFERKTDLALHVEAHTRDPSRVYCEVCNTSYAVREKGYYIYHMKKHTDTDLDNGKHPDKLMCDVCFLEIKRECYISHIIQEHSQFSCDICKWSYSSETSLFNHMKKIHSSSKVKYILKKGGGIEVQHKNVSVVYKKLKDVAPPDQDDEPGSPQTYICNTCNKTFTKRSSLESHRKKHGGKPTEQQFDCEICSAPFTSKGTYFYHIIQEHENFEPIIPQADIENHENEAKTDDSNGTKVESEEQIQHPVKKSLVTVLNPETGDFEEKEIEEDTTESEKDSISSKLAKDVVSEIIYCKLCNKCLKRDTLLEHMKEHTMFNCNLCRFSFTKKAQIFQHRKTLHVDELVTEEIERAESDEKVLNKSIESGKRKRTDLIKLCTCPVCSAEFRQDKYMEHIKSHRRVVLHCRFCGREFSKKNLLAIHEKSHERISHENELPFARNCPVCNAGILSRVNYVQHLLDEHLKQKPSVCKLCNKEFITDKILENHNKVYHDSNVRVFWTLDGEGNKFDVKTGRYGEAASDYLSEIRELNEIMKANRKPEIWLSTTPKKTGRGGNTSINKAQNKKQLEEEEESSKTEDDNEEGANADTSDEDYVPVKKRRNYSSDADDDDDDYKPSSKKKKKKRLTFSAEDESTSEEEYAHKDTRTRRPAVPVSKKSLQKKRMRHLRDRKKIKVNKKSKKAPPKRVLRSAIPSEKKTKETSDDESNSNKDSVSLRKPPKRKTADNEKASENSKPRKKYQRAAPVTMTVEQMEQYRLKPGQKYPRNCPICDLPISSRGSYEEHFMTHTKEKPYKCPYCDLCFTKEWNRAKHAEKIHKKFVKSPVKKAAGKSDGPSTPSHEPGTPADRTLRTRAKNITEEEPLSSSTPIRTTKVTVRISPLHLDEHMTLDMLHNSEKRSTPRNKTVTDKNESEKKQGSFMCEYCNKRMKSNWNYAQHIEAHKKDLKKTEMERKPFLCKTCGESFKKKRDLYIHTKVHAGNTQDEDDMDVSRTESEMNDTGNISFSSSMQDSDASVHADSSVMDISSGVNRSGKDLSDRRVSVSGSSNDTNHKNIHNVQNSVSDRAINAQSCIEKGNTRSDSRDNNNKPNSNATVGDRDKVTDAALGENAAVNTSTSSKTPKTNSKSPIAAHGKSNDVEKVLVDSNLNNEDNSSKLPAFPRDKAINKGSPFSVESDDVEHSNNGLRSDVTHRNSISDLRRQSDSETEDKTKSTKTPPTVKKMSSESALSKWKMKVQATLSSQLELNAAKKQEEMDNPEIAKVKEKLAIKGKSEKKNYECRICGVAFDLESGFRGHMDVHLSESPPYCSICDIYFMAIYPKRRLMEHNKKKHPELHS